MTRSTTFESGRVVPTQPGQAPSGDSPRIRITFVKKILEDGKPCPKCADIEARLNASGQMGRIDRVVIADERDPSSEGMLIAAEHGVSRAPFFVVEDGNEVRIHTVYFRFVKTELGVGTTPQEEARELLNDNPDLDFI